jgi:hypothetical protein
VRTPRARADPSGGPLRSSNLGQFGRDLGGSYLEGRLRQLAGLDRLDDPGDNIFDLRAAGQQQQLDSGLRAFTATSGTMRPRRVPRKSTSSLMMSPLKLRSALSLWTMTSDVEAGSPGSTASMGLGPVMIALTPEAMASPRWAYWIEHAAQ